MNPCRLVLTLLDRFIEDDFTEDERLEIMTHLGECESCQQEFESMNRLISIVEGIPLVDVPSSFKQSVMGKIKDHE